MLTIALQLAYGDDEPRTQFPIPDEEIISPTHLLISPILPPASGLVAPLSGHSRFTTKVDEYKDLVKNPTLAVWGDKDNFTADKRLRKWAQALSKYENTNHASSSAFEWRSIADVDHFWRTPTAQVRLRLDACPAMAKRQETDIHSALGRPHRATVNDTIMGAVSNSTVAAPSVFIVIVTVITERPDRCRCS